MLARWGVSAGQGVKIAISRLPLERALAALRPGFDAARSSLGDRKRPPRESLL